MHPAVRQLYIYATDKRNTISYVGGEFIIDIGTSNHYNEVKCSIRIIDNKSYSLVNERANGAKYWYLDNLAHREDGPAVEYACGKKEWFLNGHKQFVGAWFRIKYWFKTKWLKK